MSRFALLDNIPHDEVATFMNERLLRDESTFLIERLDRFKIFTHDKKTVDCYEAGGNVTICQTGARSVTFVHSEWVRLSTIELLSFLKRLQTVQHNWLK